MSKGKRQLIVRPANANAKAHQWWRSKRLQNAVMTDDGKQILPTQGVIMTRRKRLVIAPAAVLAGEIDFRMHDAHVSGERVIPGEGLVLDTKRTANLLLAGIVNGVFMTGQVVRSRENGVARLSSCWIDALTFVGTGLGVARKEGRRRHRAANAGCGGGILAMCLTFVPLQLLRRFKALRTAVIGASVGTRIG